MSNGLKKKQKKEEFLLFCFGNNIVSVEKIQDFQAVVLCKHRVELRNSFG